MFDELVLELDLLWLVTAVANNNNNNQPWNNKVSICCQKFRFRRRIIEDTLRDQIIAHQL